MLASLIGIMIFMIIAFWGLAIIAPIILVIVIFSIVRRVNYEKLETQVLEELGFSNWELISYFDEYVTVKSRSALEKYDSIKFFKENKDKLAKAEEILKRKNEVGKTLKTFLESNSYEKRIQYGRLKRQINVVLKNASAYRINVAYISSAGNNLGENEIVLNQYDVERFKKDPSLLMGKGEYNKYLKEQQKEILNQKHQEYYAYVNKIIDYANENRNILVTKGNQVKMDNLIVQLFDKTVNCVKKIKSIDSKEWDIIGEFAKYIETEIEKIISKNQRILKYYESPDFLKIKETCETVMNTQREFNEYIFEKVQSISKLFGTRVVRSETKNEDKYNYIRPYKKTLTPFTAEVSATVFASAENNPLEYIVKNFYPDKNMYPNQIQKLRKLIEELETLREAKEILENYKLEYQQYLEDVPNYIMEEDEAGFYTNLGFTNIDESVLTVEYKFVYTSSGGMVQRSFTVPMTEDTIIELINVLESKLTEQAFVKEQRALMTRKLREFIKKRDDYTCCLCGNSVYAEPNLLLEIDHKIPVSKGGFTIENNLQTLCWKCNRLKSNKIVDEY